MTALEEINLVSTRPLCFFFMRFTTSCYFKGFLSPLAFQQWINIKWPKW
jgi:hypothetical protein